MSAQPCAVCIHPQREEMEAEMSEGLSRGEIAAHFKVTEYYVHLHRQQHLSEETMLAFAEPHRLITELRELQQQTLWTMEWAKENNKPKVFLEAVYETRATLVEMMRAVEKLRPQGQTDWEPMKHAILSVLAKHPEIQDEVREALAALQRKEIGAA